MNEADIADFREFNRFHTRLVGALNEKLLASSYSLPQVRVLYEIANARGGKAPSARDLGEVLQMDTGYLSRLTSAFEKEGLVSRIPSKENAKRLALTLTEKGQAAFAELNSASIEEIKSFLSPLSVTERQELLGAMKRIRRLLGDSPKDNTFILRDPAPGDLGWITCQQGRLYAKEYGWDWTFEALVAEIVGQFVKNFDPACEKCWIAEREGEVIGSVFLAKDDEETAKLRLLYVDANARGLGLGRRLVEECIQFAQQKGYKRMKLWTNDVLVSARRIYQATGFELLEEEPHHSFGKDLVGQIWGRDL
ncbi:MAG: helix-turn-helix domain-containing GNAT family N-acetyltransferase [Cohaesibacter sp.]|jgi:DNA-binding MarR family transcriptional regulator/GNAT superfamily N-acetyltransferase|nr:helix-turn-helix domain-containing GNAT family N-acetyltransferase [Cohaesibacter sp.]